MATRRPDLLSLRLFVAVCEEASIARGVRDGAADPGICLTTTDLTGLDAQL